MKHSTKNKILAAILSLSLGLGIAEYGWDKPSTLLFNALRNTAIATKLLNRQEKEDSRKS
jgi:hypothetical protein